jgi:threonine aldolase
VEKARKVRKMMGGGMRQAGILAAAGLVAFDEVLPTLSEDHTKARALGERLAAVPGFEVDLETLQTNIVMLRLHSPHDGPRVGEALKARGVLCHVISPTQVRFVTHHDISDADLGRALEAVDGLR